MFQVDFAQAIQPDLAVGLDVDRGSGPRFAPAVVHVVDPDDHARKTLAKILAAFGIIVREYEGLGGLLQASPLDRPGCLIVDSKIRLTSLTELREQLWHYFPQHPILVVASRVDVATAVRAMKSGVTDLIEKPFRERDTLEAVGAALNLDMVRRQAASRLSELRARFASLSNRERQVLTLVTAGRLNKQVAGELGLSEITIKVHRGNAMRKMGARTLVDLVRMADAIAGRHASLAA